NLLTTVPRRAGLRGGALGGGAAGAAGRGRLHAPEPDARAAHRKPARRGTAPEPNNAPELLPKSRCPTPFGSQTPGEHRKAWRTINSGRTNWSRPAPAPLHHAG